MNRAAVLLRDLIGMAGVLLVFVGLRQIYAPAALIALGLCMATAAVLLARRA